MSSLAVDLVRSAHVVEIVWTVVSPVGLFLALASMADAAADWRLVNRAPGRYHGERVIVARGRALAAAGDALAQAALTAYAVILALSGDEPRVDAPGAELALRWALVAAQVALIAALLARRVERWKLLALFDRDREVE